MSDPFPVAKIELPRVQDEAWSRLFSPEGEMHYPFPFQVRMTQHVQQLRAKGGGFILLQLPTGSGKTRAIITPALQLRENLIAVYPTNALIEDQRRQIEPYAKPRGFEVHSIDRHHVTQIKIEKNLATKSRALYDILTTDIFGKGNKILLTNPDILNLIRHSRYGRLSPQQMYEILGNYPLIAFDELHTYDVKQLAAILHFAHWVLAQRPHVFILSTATMPERILKMLKYPHEIETLQEQVADGPVSYAQVLAPLSLTVSPVEQWGGADWAQSHLPDIKKWGEDGGCVVILDSVGECLATYSALSALVGEDQVGLVIGAVDSNSRKTEIQKPIVVGNNAIRVGIDFVKRSAVVYAFQAADALQGLGRVGRGGKADIANAVLLAPTQTANALNGFRDALLRACDGHLTRELLTQSLYETFPHYENFEAYLQKFAGLEAWLAESETWRPRNELVTELFGVPRERLDAMLQEVKQTRCLQDALVAFRGDTELGIAVKDRLMEQKGYFPFRVESPYRVFRHCIVHKNYSPHSFRELVKSQSRSDTQEFLVNMDERENYILGYAEIEWSGKSRRVEMACREPNIWNWHDQLCYRVTSCDQCPTWQFTVKSSDRRLVRLRDTINRHFVEHKIPFIVFDPVQMDLPPLFYHFAIYGQKNLRVAFGGNALLIVSLL